MKISELVSALCMVAVFFALIWAAAFVDALLVVE